MKRLTTSNPDSNASQLLNYAYSEDGRVKLAYAGMKHNANLCEYISSEAGDAGLSCAPSPDDVMEGGCMECDCVFGVLNNVAIQAAELRARLMMIEDILGEDYDLEQLREMVDAERRWIPVTERLPEESGDYLVILDWGTMCVLEFSKVHQAFNASDSIPNDSEIFCTHWMPRPQPPKGE